MKKLMTGLIAVAAGVVAAQAKATDLFTIDGHQVTMNDPFGSSFVVVNGISASHGLNGAADITGQGNALATNYPHFGGRDLPFVQTAANSAPGGTAAAGSVLLYNFVVINNAPDAHAVLPVTVRVRAAIQLAGHGGPDSFFDASASIGVGSFTAQRFCSSLTDVSQCGAFGFDTTIDALAYDSSFFGPGVTHLDFEDSVLLTARADGQDGGGGFAIADPIFTIDPSTPDWQDYSIYVSTGFGNSPPAPAGVPEPATWALMLVGFGGLGAAARLRRTRPQT